MSERNYYIYILTNKYRTVFYVGITNDLQRRVYEHKNKLVKGFTSKYNIGTLIYFEEYLEVKEAIAREKEVKDWRREKKLTLIKSKNLKLEEISF